MAFCAPLLFVLLSGTAWAQQWTETVLHSFGATSTDGYQPKAGVTMDSHGNLYGATSAGGANGHGAIFKLAAPTLFAADMLCHAVRSVQPVACPGVSAASATSTPVSNCSLRFVGNSADGTQAPYAQMQFDYATAVDASGNLYVADYRSSLVRRTLAYAQPVSVTTNPFNVFLTVTNACPVTISSVTAGVPFNVNQTQVTGWGGSVCAVNTTPPTNVNPGTICVVPVTYTSTGSSGTLTVTTSAGTVSFNLTN